MSALEIDSKNHPKLANGGKGMTAQQVQRKDTAVSSHGDSPEELRAQARGESKGDESAQGVIGGLGEQVSGLGQYVYGAVAGAAGKLTGNTQTATEGRIEQERGRAAMEDGNTKTSH